MKKLLVTAIVVLMASPAFAAIQNVKVSGDITTSWVYDNSLDLGATSAGTTLPILDKHQNVFITQTRLRVDADLSDNVSATVGLINERAWNAENSTDGLGYANDTNVQLYLASVTLREFLYSPLTLQIGRQVFNYGNGLIMGDGGPINASSGNLANIFQDINERTAYDGVTATLDYKPLTVSLIYFKNGQNLNSVQGTFVSNPDESSDVFGYNANYQLSDPWSTVVEQYLFARINGSGFSPTLSVLGAAGGDTIVNEGKGNTLYTPGLRASTNPIKGLNVQGEIAWQLGNQDVVGSTAVPEAEHRDAMAAQLMAMYSLPVMEKYKPSVNASWTYASGDKNSGENYAGDHITSAKTFTAWDEFNTIQGAGTIYREITLFSNQNILEVGASVNPMEDVTASVTWSGIWAVDAISAKNPLVLLQPDGTGGAGVGPVGPAKAYWEGNETDLGLTYNYTEDVTFGLSIGWFVPGDVFGSNSLAGTLHDTASQAIANVGVKF